MPADMSGNCFKRSQTIRRKSALSAKKARRLFGTGAAIVFKGSGFYETDYRSDSYKKGVDAEKKKSDSKSESGSGESASTTKANAKTESKPDKKESKSPPPKKKSDD